MFSCRIFRRMRINSVAYRGLPDPARLVLLSGALPMSRKNRLYAALHTSLESLEHRLMLAAQLIKDVNPAGDTTSDPPVLFQLNASTALFVHDDGVSGDELWKTNGTPGGTHLVK